MSIDAHLRALRQYWGKMVGEIANADLTESDLPSPHAEWHEIGRFALSFNGYERWGSFKKCAEIGYGGAEAFRAEGVLPSSLTELRTCLFFEQRRWRHYGFDPDEQAMEYIRALVERIREEVGATETDGASARRDRKDRTQ